MASHLMSQARQIMGTKGVAPQHSLPAASAAQQSALNFSTGIATLPVLGT